MKNTEYVLIQKGPYGSKKVFKFNHVIASEIIEEVYLFLLCATFSKDTIIDAMEDFVMIHKERKENDYLPPEEAQ